MTEIDGNYIFSECHGVNQLSYLEWKASQMNFFQPKITNKFDKPMLRTPSHTIFSEFYQHAYQDHRKAKLPIYYLQQLDVFGLLVWYLDDGCFSKGTPTIGSMIFSFTDLSEATTILNKKLETNLRVRTEKHPAAPYYKIVIPKESRLKLFPIWKDLFARLSIPKSMMYKIGC